MKIVFTLIILCVSLPTQAQSMSNRNYSNTSRNSYQEPQKYSAEREAGILRFDTEEVLKKLKIKPEDEETAKITAILKVYDDKIENIQLMYRAIFREVDQTVEAKTDELRSSNNPETFKALQAYIVKNVTPVQEQVNPIVEDLRKGMEGILTAKKYQKWMKYQKRMSEKIVKD